MNQHDPHQIDDENEDPAEFFARAFAEKESERVEKEKARLQKLAKKAVPIGKNGEPPPRSFLVEELLPEGFITILFGNGGSGKSFLAMLLALSVVLGIPFFGRNVKRGKVLWVDAEDLGLEEIERRTWQVARGLGFEPPPDGLYFYQVRRSLANSKVAEEIRAIVETNKVVLVVVDSLSAGAVGVDVSSAQDTVTLMRGLKAWGTTVIALDHVSKRAATGEAAMSIFGSIFKHNLSRSALGLSAAGPGGLLKIQHLKANFARKSSGVYYRVEFDEGGDERKPSVRFQTVDRPDECPVQPRATSEEVTLTTLQDLFSREGEPIPVDVIARERALASKTVSNQLSSLSAKGLVQSHNGAWTPVEDGVPVPSLSDAIEVRDGKEEAGEGGVSEAHLPSFPNAVEEQEGKEDAGGDGVQSVLTDPSPTGSTPGVVPNEGDAEEPRYDFV